AEAHTAHLRLLAVLQRVAVVVDHDQLAVALDDRSLLREVQGDDLEVLALDVAPHVELGPVGHREDPHRLALGELGVGGTPELRALLARLPAVTGLAQREDALLRPGTLLVATGPAEGGVVPTLVERL